MIVYRLARLAAATVVALAGFTAIAAAAAPQVMTATTNTMANLRQGPGTTYSTVDSLDEGTDVIVHACTAAWCAVSVDDENGFIYKQLLDFGDNDDEGDTTPPPKPPKPPKKQPHSDAGVCFFKSPGFNGPSFCAAGGEGGRVPFPFRNKIRSILLDDGVAVEVCAGGHLNGECKTLDHSVKFLPSDAHIGSFQVGGDDGGHWTGPGDNPDDADDSDDEGDDSDDDGNGLVLQ